MRLKKFMRGPGSYVVIILIVLLFVSMFKTAPKTGVVEPYSQFMKRVENKEFTRIYVVENDAVALKNGTALDPGKFPQEYDVYTYLPSIDVFMADTQKLLGTNPQDSGVTITFKAKAEPNFLMSLVPYILLTGQLS
jgi:ATP-dependent Zn protease